MKSIITKKEKLWNVWENKSFLAMQNTEGENEMVISRNTALWKGTEIKHNEIKTSQKAKFKVLLIKMNCLYFNKM